MKTKQANDSRVPTNKAIDPAILAGVSEAVVTLAKNGGHGVLVTGNLILTAAHCIDFDCTGGMALGDFYVEEIETRLGKIKVSPVAVEPLSDIAVLGAVDIPELYDETVRFEEFCEQTKPVAVCEKDHEPFQPFSIYICNNDMSWIRGSAQVVRRDAHMVVIQPDKMIEGGASGGPIVNESGGLVGIVTSASRANGEVTPSMAPRPHLTLPVWVYPLIREQSGL